MSAVLTETGVGGGASMIGSYQTVPVNQSDVALFEGRVPAGVISIPSSLNLFLVGFYAQVSGGFSCSG
ncbi:hypothetical protein MWU63_16795 [Pseudohalocynthiibacter sp. F2068]|jgi:hypothetical protein|nr:hypothetical protein [Pseudohalocynthiibacter sp. F2068]